MLSATNTWCRKLSTSGALSARRAASLPQSLIVRPAEVMPAKKIEVGDEVFAYLQHEAIPFVDITPNDVLRRKLLAHAPNSSPEGRQGNLMPPWIRAVIATATPGLTWDPRGGPRRAC